MATVTPVSKRMQIRWNTGLDENFDPIYSMRSWSNIKHAATNEQILQLGQYFGQLCEHTLSAIRLIETNELE